MRAAASDWPFSPGRFVLKRGKPVKFHVPGEFNHRLRSAVRGGENRQGKEYGENALRHFLQELAGSYPQMVACPALR